MPDFAESIERIHGVAVEKFVNYYRSLAIAAQGIPSRADFDPLDIQTILPKVWLYAKVDGDFLIRVTGTEFDERYGVGVKPGGSIRQFLPDGVYNRIAKRLNRVLETGWFAHGWSGFADPVSNDLIERAYGPMLDNNGERTLVFGVTDFGNQSRRWMDKNPPSVASSIDLYDPVSGEVRERGFDPD